MKKIILALTLIVMVLVFAVYRRAGAAVMGETRTYLPLVTLGRSMTEAIVFTQIQGNSAYFSTRQVAQIAPDGWGAGVLSGLPSGQNTQPAVSPDGNAIVFVNETQGLIYYDRFSLRAIPLGILGYEPAWSPQADRLVFVAGEGLMVVAIDAGQLIGEPELLVAGDVFNPAWSPDGTRIAYTAWVRAARVIHVLNLQDQSVLEINILGAMMQPAWSPDGETLAFGCACDSNAPDNVDVYTLNLNDANTLTRLTTSPLADYAPDWSPDGLFVVFTRFNTESQNSLYIVGADGQGEHLLVENGDEPDWGLMP